VCSGWPASFFDLQAFLEEEEGGEDDSNVVGVNGETHRRGLLGKPSSSVLVKLPGRANRDPLGLVAAVLDEGEELLVAFREDSCWD